MSPKRKKLEAALDSMFSSARKPAERFNAQAPSNAPAPEQPLQSSAILPAAEPALTEEPALPVPTTTAVPALHEPGLPAVQDPEPARDHGRSPSVPNSEPGEEAERFVLFKIDGVSYGLNITCVESIIKLQPITFVPHAHPWVEGVTNLRGTVLPVINLRSRFGTSVCDAVYSAKGEWNKNTRIMVVALREEKVGIVVDEVSEVIQIPLDGIEPPPPLATSTASSFITGIAKMDGNLAFTLDLGKVLFV